jgi:hypothetical protein
MREDGAKKSKVLPRPGPFFSLSLLSVTRSFVFPPVCVQLSWSKSLVSKWFNIRGTSQDFHADSDAGQGTAQYPAVPVVIQIISGYPIQSSMSNRDVSLSSVQGLLLTPTRRYYLLVLHRSSQF